MLSVLKNKVEEFSVTTSIIPAHIETFEACERADAAILMTDTISYFWPKWVLRRALVAIHRMLLPGGVLTVDVGLWAGYEGESRREEWTIQADALTTVTTTYSASILPFDKRELDRAPILFRSETLSFMASKGERWQCASRQSVLHALKLSELLAVANDAGFVLALANIPGNSSPIQLSGTEVCYRRLYLSFVPA
jgi:hypothetical protein